MVNQPFFHVIGHESYQIGQNNGHYAVQGHSRSLILVPVKSAYVTSYYCLILT